MSTGQHTSKPSSNSAFKQFFKHLFLNNRFFYGMYGIAVLFVFGFIFPSFFGIAQLILLGYVILVLLDILLLFKDRKGINGERILPEKFSNSDPNPVTLNLKNNYNIDVDIDIVDELPEQFQKRDFSLFQKLKSGEKTSLQYDIIPHERGEYHFGFSSIKKV